MSLSPGEVTFGDQRTITKSR